MVNLDGAGGVFSLLKIDGGCGVRVVEYSSDHLASACARFDGDAGEVSAEDVVTCIAPVVVYICPGLAELFA